MLQRRQQSRRRNRSSYGSPAQPEAIGAGQVGQVGEAKATSAWLSEFLCVLAYPRTRVCVALALGCRRNCPGPPRPCGRGAPSVGGRTGTPPMRVFPAQLPRRIDPAVEGWVEVGQAEGAS